MDEMILENQIKDTFLILEKIEQTTSTVDKKNYLIQGKKNQVLRDLLAKTYNPFKVYYVKNVVLEESSRETKDMDSNFRSFISLLEKLEARIITGNEALWVINVVFSKMTPIEKLWYLRVLKKDLNIGIKAKTINSVFIGLIPEFGVQLAKEYDGRLPNSIIVQPKLDGYRAIGSTTLGHLFSRNGKRIEGYADIEKQLKQLPKDLMIDGEIMAKDFKGTQSSVFKHQEDKKGILNIFDVYGGDNIEEKSQFDRIMFMFRLFGDIDPDIITDLQLLRSWYVDKVDKQSQMTEILDIYNTCVASGYEGIMIKDSDAKYEMKRGYNWQKMKPVKSIDLKVTGIESGGDDTKYSNCLGRLVCDFEGDEVRVGSGLSDQQRMDWWEDPTLIVGKTIEILYQEVSENQNGGKSLRFPRFKCMRPDKD